MECKLELSVFRFDAKTDFLPYYKKHFITIDRSKSVNDLLALIHAEDNQFGYDTDEFAALKINGKAFFCSASIDGIVASFGKELTLEPLSSKRAIKDMQINEEDFYERFELLAPFVDEKDKAIFQSYKIYHYASSMLSVHETYLGDALFAFAADMMNKHPEHRQDILEVIANEHNGIFLHTKLCKKIYPCGADVEKKIVGLKNDILKQRPFFNPLIEKLAHHCDVVL